MMRYRRRANHLVMVEAIQWDGDIETFGKMAEMLDPRPDQSMLTRDGRLVFEHAEEDEPIALADQGSWVITNGAGFAQVLRNDEFESEYEPCPAE